MPSFESTHSCWTHRGGRRSNQDAVVRLELPDGRELVAVADGMGGRVGGAVASRLALETVVARLRRGDTLGEAVRAAGGAVYQAARERPEWQGMATTLVALLRSGRRYEIANVGDSRAYRVAEGGTAIAQITRDHSFMAEASARGEMSLEEVQRSPWRHAVTRAIGLEAEVEVDLFGPFAVRQPHYVLLCSDGLSNVLSDAAIAQRFADLPDPRTVAARLGAEALAAQSADNVTAAVVRFERRRRWRRPGGTGTYDAARPPRRRAALASSIWRRRLLEIGLFGLALVVLAVFLFVLVRMS